MLMKKKFSHGESDGVRYGNGELAIGGVKLNVFSYEEDGVLIDTGAIKLRDGFRSFIDKVQPEQVVLTHHHEDHTGLAGEMNKTGLPVSMHPLFIEASQKKADYPLYRKLFWGKRPPFQANALGASFASAHANWAVIFTPGHAKDHVSLLNRETGHLFTGDLFTMKRTKVVLRDECIPDIIQSLERLLTYDFKKVYCSHAGPLKDGREALTAKRDYLLELQFTIKNKAAQGKSIRQIRDELLPGKYPISLFSGGEWDSIHLIRSLLEDDARTLE